eukprot:GHRR01009559.1.p1 GENE.GHRR01009559.1~~GHRR01009559.1.p1  ORF type:complete len:729 (+),score=358.87 GHRR01009559.1:168-2354(+)
MQALEQAMKKQRLNLMADKGDNGDDLVAYMAARGGLIEELETELAALQKQHQDHMHQAKLKDAEISSLRSQLTTWRAIKEAEAASLTSSNKQLAAQLAREIARGKTLDNQLSKTQQEWTRSKQQVEELQQQLSMTQQQAAVAASAADLASQDLNQQLTACQRDAVERSRLAQQTLALHKDRLTAEQESHSMTQQQLADTRQQLSAAVASAAAAEAAAARNEGRAIKAEMQATNMAGSEMQVMLKMLQEQLKRQSQQLAGAQEAMQQARLVHGLRQQLQEAQQELNSSRIQMEELQVQAAQLEQVQNEVNLWRTAFKSTLGLDHPSPQAIQALRNKQQHVEKQHHDAQVQLLSLRTENKDLHEKLAVAEARQADVSSQIQQAQQQVQQLQLSLRLAQTERDGLNRLVTLLEQEQADGPGAADAAGASAAVAAHGSALQQPSGAAACAKVESLQALVAQLQTALAELQGRLTAATAAKVAAKAAQAEAESQAKALTRENDELNIMVAGLQSQLSDGDYDPSASRILHLVANPRAEMDRLQDKALLDQYKEENEQLKQALARAAAAAGSAGQAAAANSSGSGMASAGAGNAVDPAVAAAVAAAEVKLTTRKLQEANKQNDRLKSMFKHHAQAFRDGCRVLFGYRMEMVCDPCVDTQHAPATYTLASCLGSKDDVLMFRYHPNADPQYTLLKTPLSQKLKQDVDVFINNFKSIPAFTANYTMTLFQQTTSGG